jgi:hypothetical protein
MLKFGKWIVILACVALPVLSGCDEGDEATSGVETSHGGTDLATWMKQYWTWTISGTGTGRSGDMAYLPLPNATDPDGDGTFTGVLDTTLAAADGFVLPMLAWVGERYDDGTPDDDRTHFSEADFAATTVTVTLDGTKIIDSAAGPINDYYYGPLDFDAPIVYPAPSDYHSIAAIWVQGIGFLHAKLTAGVHTLHLQEHNAAMGLGYDNTWNITVH